MDYCLFSGGVDLAKKHLSDIAIAPRADNLGTA